MSSSVSGSTELFQKPAGGWGEEEREREGGGGVDRSRTFHGREHERGVALSEDETKASPWAG